MISSPGTEVGPGPRKPKMPSQTSHITGLVGDHEKLNFQQNIVENFVGVELEELSDEDEKKPAEVVQKDNHKSSNVDVAQSNNPEHPGESANTTGRPAGVANQDVEIVNQEGNNPQEPNSNIEPLEPENNSPEQLAAEIQANIQEEKVLQAESFVFYMLTLDAQISLIFVVTGCSILANTNSFLSLHWGLLAGILSDLLIKSHCIFTLWRKKEGEQRRNRLKATVELISFLKDVTLGFFLVR